MTMTDLHREMMLEAVREATQGYAAGHGTPFGAVLARKGEIITKGHNMIFSTGDATAHAEMVVLREAAQKLGTTSLEDCVLYATGQPCIMCLATTMTLRVPVLYYAATYADAAVKFPSTGPLVTKIMLDALHCRKSDFSGDFASSEGLTVIRLSLPEALALLR